MTGKGVMKTAKRTTIIPSTQHKEPSWFEPLADSLPDPKQHQGKGQGGLNPLITVNL